MYTQGNLVTTLEAAYQRLPVLQHSPAPVVAPRARRTDQKAVRSRTGSTPSQARSPNKSKNPAKVVASIMTEAGEITSEFHNKDEPFEVPAPKGWSNMQLVDLHVNALRSNNAFDVSQPCAVCNETGHTFDECAVLKNIDFLHKHFIGRLFII